MSVAIRLLHEACEDRSASSTIVCCRTCRLLAPKVVKPGEMWISTLSSEQIARIDVPAHAVVCSRFWISKIPSGELPN